MGLWTMKDKERENWAKVRARGKRRFVWLNGVAGYGGAMFVGMTLVKYILKFGWTINASQEAMLSLVIGMILWPIAGFCFGLWVWKTMESAYLASNREKEIENGSNFGSSN